MSDQSKPSKDQARHWIDQRTKNRRPLPDQKELRRQLGMDLIEAERRSKKHEGKG